MSRSVIWQRGPSDAVSWRQDQALNATIYILRELGPTSFLLKEEGQIRKFKVLLGDPHCCDCPEFKKEKSPCKHICWILLKKFKLDRQNDLSYQLGLVEREINEVLSNPAKSHPTLPASKTDKLVHETEGRKELEQRPLSEDDVCPICQETLLAKRQPVTYCRHGCGNSVHIKCMKVWVDHQRQANSGGDVITCPFCRGEFASPKLLALELRNTWHENKKTSDRLDVHTGVTCNNCRLDPIKGKCYQCTTCSNYYLCNTCFHNKQHFHHTFVFRLKKSQRWRSAPSRDRSSHAETLMSPIVNELQSREITENDYEVLLQLDRPLGNSQGIPVDPAGLPEHVINRLPMSKLRDGSRLLAPGRQCRLCLHGYTAGQFVRRLPQCGHIFHRHCIDGWLGQDHRCCPVDRVEVVVAESKQSSEGKRRKRSSQGSRGGEDQEMVIPGVGLIRFSPRAATAVRNKSTPSNRRLKNASAKRSSPVNDVTLSELLVQADAICLNGSTNRQVSFPERELSAGVHRGISSPLQIPLISKMASDRRKSGGGNEVMRRARLRKFEKKSEWQPGDDIFSFTVNGTQCPNSVPTNEGQRSSGDVGISTLDYSRVTDASGNILPTGFDYIENKRATSGGIGRHFYRDRNFTHKNGSSPALRDNHPPLSPQKAALAPHSSHVLIAPMNSLELNESN